MKRHHLAFFLCVIFAGVSVYKGFHDGDMDRSIWMGIAFTTLGIVSLFYKKLPSWLSPIGIALPLLLLGVTVCRDLFSTNMVVVIIIGIGFAFGIVLTLYQDMPFVREKIRPRLRPVPYIALGLLLALEFLPYSVDRKAKESTKPVGSGQKQGVSQEFAISNDSQKSVGAPNLSPQQAVHNLITSEKFKQYIKEAAEAGTVPESLKSLSNFQDHLVSEGVEGFAEYDFSTLNLQNNFQSLFQKYHPGQVPSDLDVEMRQQFVDAVQKFGYQEGKEKFMQTPEVIAWSTVRFEMWKLTDFSKPQEGNESISAWMNSIDFADFRDIEEVPVSTPSLLQEDTFSDVSPLDAPVAEREQAASDHKPPAAWSEPTMPIPGERSVRPRPVEPGKVVSEVSLEPPVLPTDEALEHLLKERFSSERLERARDTLERYGEEEGLRRLRESDPEIARAC